ncbi:MAG: hypothetical protein IKL68_04200 [Clostridia bacterium]|nr:hypothetical protein [Clostridia bacterium]
MAKEFEIKPHTVPTDAELQFIWNFSDSSDRNILARAFTEGVSLEEVETLGIGKEKVLSIRERVALFSRYQYKWSYKVARRIMEQSFDEEQLDVIANVILLPAFCISEEKLLNEILYDKYNKEYMVNWLRKNRVG